MSFFGRIWSNFEFKKVTCCLYHSGTVRHSTVNTMVSLIDSLVDFVNTQTGPAPPDMEWSG